MEIKDYFTKQIFYTDFCLVKREPFDLYHFDRELVLSNLSTVNIFVGANNSGKSRLLRELFQMPDFQYKTNFFIGTEFRDLLSANIKNSWVGNLDDLLERCKVFEFDPYLKSHPAKGINEFFKAGTPFLNHLQSWVLQTQQFSMNNISAAEADYSTLRVLEVDLGQHFAFWRNALTNTGQLLKSFLPKIANEKRYYIPILRGMRSFSNTSSNEYAIRTGSDYFAKNSSWKNGDFSFDVFTGLELYEDLKNKLLGEPDDRALVRDFEMFLGKQFFDGKSVTLIPREGKDVVHVKIGDEKQLPMHQLGDGLQNLIIITYQMFMQKERCLFFIEEPDLSMHPGMQRALLEVMTEHNQHQYFLTTHSNHLLDMVSEFKATSIYLFSKSVADSKTTYTVKQASSPDVNILKELGVHNSSVFLTNATVWVEGITDRLYLRAYLKKYIDGLEGVKNHKCLREDYHYSYVEYQGSNLTHWTFDQKDQTTKIKANYLCGHSFLIADGDVSEKGSRKADYTEMLGDRFQILKCKEIENLIPPEVLKELVKDKFKAKSKSVEVIDFGKYSTSYDGLGDYLDGLLGKKVFASESGTIKGKVNFCENAVEIMQRPDFAWELTPPLKKLCEKVYQFILEQNK